MTRRILTASLLTLFALAPLSAQPDPTKEELKLKLPKPMFIGTPTNLKSANLETVTGKPRAPFYVPKGTVLLSLKKPVTASDMQPVIGEPDMVDDGGPAGALRCAEGHLVAVVEEAGDGERHATGHRRARHGRRRRKGRRRRVLHRA